MSTKLHQRQQINLQLVQTLYELVDKYPSMRFSQILGGMGFVQGGSIADKQTGETLQRIWMDEYNVEQEQILARVMKAIEFIEAQEKQCQKLS